MARLTIYDIKRLTAETNTCFFSRQNMKFAGQTLKSFSVQKQFDGRYLIQAKAKDFDGNYRFKTVRYFNPKNNELESN